MMQDATQVHEWNPTPSAITFLQNEILKFNYIIIPPPSYFFHLTYLAAYAVMVQPSFIL